MNAQTTSSVFAFLLSAAVRSPAFFSAAIALLWASNEIPWVAPIPWINIASGRAAVIAGSFWRNAPAAVLRGFANVARP